MARTKHTPGPWRIERVKTTDVHEWFVFADNAATGCHMPASADTKANAQLIAAAPDMLEALQLIACGADGPRTARAAIAKAEGR